MTHPGGRASVTVVLSADALLNANHRHHPQVRRKRVAAVRAQFADAAADAPHLIPPVHVDVHLAFNRGHRRDAPNWSPTAKAGTDGLVDAGVLPDDSDKQVTTTTFHAHTVDKTLPPKHVRVTLTLTEAHE